MTQADYDAAYADLQTSTPAVDASKAAVDQAKANLEQAQTNLAYTTIKSPVKGVIVDRRVNVGQTVVSSLNAPSLFLIAKDLKRLQLWASVNEADIGQIHADQTAKFTVDAYPRKTFNGVVSQIRLNATMTQNVVTYTVVVNTDNSSGQLLPYLTANVQFEVAHRDNALMVPTAALRWRPQPPQVVADARDAFVQSTRRREAAKEGQGQKPKKRDGTKRELPSVWLDEDGFVRPVPVQTGLTDGTRMEIVSGDLKEGTRVVVGEQRHEEGATTKNPFLPSFFRGSSRKSDQKGQ
jgi:HlyD family secretion protein